MENIVESDALSELTFQDSYDKIIKTFPIYYKIFSKYMDKGKDVSWELNRLYKPIFSGLMEYYENFMDPSVITNIMNDIKNKYNPTKCFATIDYLEYLYGNIYYETFLYEIKKIDPLLIKYEHLCVFEYIIQVECIKYSEYTNVIKLLEEFEPESKLLLVMNFRLTNCAKKISFCISWLERNFSTHDDIIKICYNFIQNNNLNSKLDLNSVASYNSFMELNKNNK